VLSGLGLDVGSGRTVARASADLYQHMTEFGDTRISSRKMRVSFFLGLLRKLCLYQRGIRQYSNLDAKASVYCVLRNPFRRPIVSSMYGLDNIKLNVTSIAASGACF
jgi:hypothetical protein